jgi:uncharacterized small protein (DUF1192 family)
MDWCDSAEFGPLDVLRLRGMGVLETPAQKKVQPWPSQAHVVKLERDLIAQVYQNGELRNRQAVLIEENQKINSELARMRESRYAGWALFCAACVAWLWWDVLRFWL